jgi:hypothetical protein
MEGISFFSESDMTRKADGTKIIASEYPAWYNDQIFDEIKEELKIEEHKLESGIVQKEQVGITRERISRLKKRVADIENSRPTLSGADESNLDKTRKALEKGLADGHMEVRRSQSADIPVDDTIAMYARASNVPIIDGKINRDGAAKIWKIAQKYFGDISNTELLRKA